MMIEPVKLIDALVEVGFCATTGEATRLIRGGGAKVNDRREMSLQRMVVPFDKIGAGKMHAALFRPTPEPAQPAESPEARVEPCTDAMGAMYAAIHSSPRTTSTARPTERGAVEAWQPIETCPTDGRAFIVWSKSCNLRIAYGREQDGSFGAATHWMRPAAPDALSATDQAAEVGDAFIRLCDALGIPATAAAYLEAPRLLATATDQAAEVEKLRHQIIHDLAAERRRYNEESPTWRAFGFCIDIAENAALATQPATERSACNEAHQHSERLTPAIWRTMGEQEKQAIADLHALQHDGTTLAAKPIWGGSIICWAVDEIKGLRAALQNGGE